MAVGAELDDVAVVELAGVGERRFAGDGDWCGVVASDDEPTLAVLAGQDGGEILGQGGAGVERQPDVAVGGGADGQGIVGVLEGVAAAEVAEMAVEAEGIVGHGFVVFDGGGLVHVT